jgi:PAS domain S-box-containing protein
MKLQGDRTEDPADAAAGRRREERQPLVARWQTFPEVQRLSYREWFDFASEGYVRTDLAGLIQDVNYAAAALLNSRRDFLLGKPLGLFLAESHRRRFYSELAGLTESGRVEPWDALLRGERGEPREISLAATVLATEDDHPLQVRWLLRDIRAVRRIERALLVERSLSDSLLESAEILILFVNDAGRIVRCNPFVSEVSGLTPGELTGRDWCEALVSVEDRETARVLLKEVEQTGAGRSGVLGMPGRQGHHFVTWSGRTVGEQIVLLGHDVTELQEAQRHRLQAARLAAIGQMSAGLAHESRNALQRSQACLSILQLRLKLQPELLELLARMQKAQDDLRHLFEDVRNYAADLPLRVVGCDLRTVWREAWTDLATLPEWASAQLHEDIEGVELSCTLDPFYLKQVFRNLLENALASGAKPARVFLRCRPNVLGEREAIQVCLRDNGPGFPPETRSQLFEPFFTTKLRGTGLGLAICKRIIEAHGGGIEAGTEAAPGAEIRIILPRRRA